MRLIDSFGTSDGGCDEEKSNAGDPSGDGFAERLTLSTLVKAKGENFSDGQRQVLSMCRIFARRSKLMLLDEAISSMDKETDAEVQKVLRDELKDTSKNDESRCLITVAHRLQTISDYDKVVVMGSGEILEEGSPEELMKKKGHFHDMKMHSNDSDTP
jgi:ABC-type multidrug transport system fused ATPase/permease subunit